MNSLRIIALSVCLTTLSTTSKAASPSVPSTPKPAAAAAIDAHLVLGNDACVKCHAPEIDVWKKTPHARTFDELHRSPEAKQIASKLGLRSIKHEGRCVACHYTQKVDAGNPHVIAGVSCESCHGGAKNWVDLHQDYGGEGITRLSESPAHRAERITRSVSAGMRNPINVYDVAQSCLRCHTTADEELVNKGGHSAGSLEFEFVSWSQGTIMHNFVKSDGKVNQPSSPDRLRVMFVAGMIATEKATYGITSARRGARAVSRLESVASKVDSPILGQILAVAKGVTFKLNNRSELTSAADKVADFGHQFAQVTEGQSLSGLDKFIPKSRK